MLMPTLAKNGLLSEGCFCSPLLRMVCLVWDVSRQAGTSSLRSSNLLFKIFLLLCSDNLCVVLL